MNSPGIVSFTPFNVIYKMNVEKDKIKDHTLESNIRNPAIMWEFQIMKSTEKERAEPMNGYFHQHQALLEGRGTLVSSSLRIAVSSSQLCLERLI